jgi:hypothetical protein
MNGRRLFAPPADGPAMFVELDPRELARSVRYAGDARCSSDVNGELLKEKQQLLERIGKLETSVEFQRRHIDFIRKEVR